MLEAGAGLGGGNASGIYGNSITSRARQEAEVVSRRGVVLGRRGVGRFLTGAARAGVVGRVFSGWQLVEFVGFDASEVFAGAIGFGFGLSLGSGEDEAFSVAAEQRFCDSIAGFQDCEAVA